MDKKVEKPLPAVPAGGLPFPVIDPPARPESGDGSIAQSSAARASVHLAEPRSGCPRPGRRRGESLIVPRTGAVSASESPSAETAPASPEAVEFVRFCYARRRVGWPELYDEMCAVAARGLFRGWGADELADQGIGFSLFDMPALARLATRVVAEDREAARRVAVVAAAPA